MNTIDVCPSPVFGPTSMKKFGKPATVVPRDFDAVEIPLPERGPPIHHREAISSAEQQPL